MLPFLCFVILQEFNERMKFMCIPVILVNGLFMFVVILLSGFNYFVFFYHSGFFFLRVLHGLNLLGLIFMMLMIFIVDKFFSSEFDFYDEA